MSYGYDTGLVREVAMKHGVEFGVACKIQEEVDKSLNERSCTWFATSTGIAFAKEERLNEIRDLLTDL